MNHAVTEHARIVTEIERLHSAWVQCELAQDISGILALCSDEIELWPPDAGIVKGREAVAAYLSGGQTRIQKIEISERRVRAGSEHAVLTAHFHTTFQVAGEPVPQTMTGSHLWVLHRQDGRWLVEVVTWRKTPRSQA
jgi:ketosteroid isomerase-like protein